MFRSVWRRAGATGVLALVLASVLWAGAIVHLTTVELEAQQRRLELYVAAVSNATSQPAVDLTAEDLVVTENGLPGRIVQIERYSLPVKLTIIVDNGGSRAAENLLHYRNALRALIESLPEDLEAGVIALAPNPRWLARPTTNRADLLRSAELLVPDEFPGRFNDALVEYGARLEREFKGDVVQARQTYMPILVALGGTGLDGSEARRDDLYEMLEALVKYGVRTHFAMVGESSGSLAEGSQVFVAKAVQEVTRGQYEALAAPSRVATLLPEWGKQIAMTHKAGSNQYRVTLDRPVDVAGEITNLAMFVNREGYSGVVTIDGRVP